jgi:hypothetical protein
MICGQTAAMNAPNLQILNYRPQRIKTTVPKELKMTLTIAISTKVP